LLLLGRQASGAADGPGAASLACSQRVGVLLLLVDDRQAGWSAGSGRASFRGDKAAAAGDKSVRPRRHPPLHPSNASFRSAVCLPVFSYTHTHTTASSTAVRRMASSNLLLDGHLIEEANAGPATPAPSSPPPQPTAAGPDRQKGLLGQIGAKGAGAMTGAVATSLLSTSLPHALCPAHKGPSDRASATGLHSCARARAREGQPTFRC
jgi:hypothetical protein